MPSSRFKLESKKENKVDAISVISESVSLKVLAEKERKDIQFLLLYITVVLCRMLVFGKKCLFLYVPKYFAS